MAVRLQFEGIRCFADPQDAVIRPITLLVGENSSGKTTFLALCRIANAIANGFAGNPPFNADPFWLGAFDQIASNRGSAGRAKSFSVAISVDKEAVHSSLRTEYYPHNGQPWPRTWRLEAGDLAVQVSRGRSQQVSISFESPAGRTNVPNPGLDFDFIALLRPDQWAPSILNQSALSQSDLTLLSDALDHIIREFLPSPYALAPIRTSPKRTYDPVNAEPNPEGSHVPMLLAALSRSGKKQWAALQSVLTEFGAKSGLFQGIEIVDKGRTEGDPFQIGVKSGGRMFNLIDVGYGVSQALPILVDTLRRASAIETFLLQQPEVHLHPKAQAELGSFFARRVKGKSRFVIETHSDYLVDRIGMEVRRTLLRPEDVSLLYFERGKSGATIHSLELDANGGITNPPPGFRQFFLKEELDLLGI